MRLYGSLQELAELVIRLASGKTVKVSSENQPSGASEKIVKIPDMGTVDTDKIVLETAQQTLTQKTLTGVITNGTSNVKVQNADITGTNNLQIPQGNSLVLRHLSSNGNRLYLGTGGAQPLEIADLITSQQLENKSLISPNISGGTLKGANVGGVGNGEPVSIEGTSKVKFVSNTIDTDRLALINGQKEIVSFATKELGKAYGGAGADMTNVTFPASGVLVTEAGSQTLSNKTIGSVTAASGILSVLGTGALRLPFGTNAQKPAGVAADLKGMIRYNDEQDAFEGYNELSGWSALGGGGTTDRVSQAAHGFALGDVLWLDPGNPPTIPASYKKAKADAANTAEVVGMVSRVIDAGTFELTLSGEVTGLSGLVAGEVYFLSPSTDGALTVTEPSVVGQVSLPVGVASSTTSLYVAPKRGVVVGGANLRTQIGLNGAALVSQTTNIQNVTAYTAGELSGWVYIDATTDRRFYIQVQFVKDAANAWKASYQTTGDTPPAGFNVDVIVSGSDAFVQVQMPPVAGWVSGSVNFALNAPAVGTTLPLQISGSLVTGPVLAAQTGAAIPAGYVGQVLTTYKNTTTIMTSGAWTEVTSLTLTPGTWMVRASTAFNEAGATITQANVACGITRSNAEIGANYDQYRVKSAAQLNNNTSRLTEVTLIIPPFYVRNDGTNTYLSDGTTFTVGSQTIRLSCFGGVFSAGATQVTHAMIEAVRIA